MALAIFDLDNTLIAGDSDHGWGEFLVARKKVDISAYRAAMTSSMQITRRVVSISMPTSNSL